MSTLYLVGTPIGHLSDLSMRAIEVLKSVDLIACEHPMHTKKLLHHYHILTPTTPYHQHNEASQASHLTQALLAGQSIALVSDAGLPNMSDPGLTLVQNACMQGLKVQTIPGACAATTALIASGLPTIPHFFGGFLPPKSKQRCDALRTYASLKATLVFYEAPHRIHATLTDAHHVLGARPACLARELTKQYETYYRDDLAALATLTATPMKGEMVLMIAGATTTDANEADIRTTLAHIQEHTSSKQPSP